jgi:UDP-2-acetamido-3-amino-2,3-dideoxy-glucuronate N-acetyltransferase
MIHYSAIVETKIDDSTNVWHNAVIREGAKIGKNCTICQGVFIDSGVIIGNGCKIKNNAMLFDGVELGDDVFIGPGVSFTNVINPRAFISRKHEFKKTLVKKGATIGAGATIVCGIEIGEYAFVGAGSVVTKDVMAYEKVYGVPARSKGSVDILCL